MNFMKLFRLKEQLDERLDQMQAINEETIERLDEERQERTELNKRLEGLRIELGVMTRKTNEQT